MEKYFKLPKPFAEKWLVALRSGEYKQGTHGSFFNSIDNNYCCLGVACIIVGANDDDIRGVSLLDENYLEIEQIDEIILKGYPEQLSGEGHLSLLFAGLNDGTVYKPNEVHYGYKFRKEYKENDPIQLSFSEIADFIEDNTEFYEVETQNVM